MFNHNQDVQVIKQVSGHMSNAVRIYKWTSDKLCRQASEAIQCVKETSEAKPSCDVKVQSDDCDDFMPVVSKIRTPMKAKLELNLKFVDFY